MTLLLLLSKQELHKECDCTLVGIGSDFAWTNKNIRRISYSHTYRIKIRVITI